MSFQGESWNVETWGDWCDVLLFLQWEGAGRLMPEDWHELSAFCAEWFRALFDGGKEQGLVVYQKR